VSGEANCVKTLVAPASAKEKDQHDNQENQHDATSWDTGLTDCPAGLLEGAVSNRTDLKTTCLAADWRRSSRRACGPR
jgi:hypothetical protein